ncbi:hypothetical protein AJ88_46920 [Mesorhizobium amorphae CCBAU 01583]|nr:hypothetical protein AJ88_46920 [Mesorhizobium amorphae CCBAU 01583]
MELCRLRLDIGRRLEARPPLQEPLQFGGFFHEHPRTGIGLVGVRADLDADAQQIDGAFMQIVRVVAVGPRINARLVVVEQEVDALPGVSGCRIGFAEFRESAPASALTAGFAPVEATYRANCCLTSDCS